MYMKLKDGKSKVLTLSYDDAVVQDIRLINILDKHGIKATFNVNTGQYLPEDTTRERYYGRMKLSEAVELYKNSGHEVAVHGLNHPLLHYLKTDELLVEILEDRKNIEKQYGTLARGMAYPYGKYNDEVISCLEKCGICYSRTTKTTEKFEFPKNWLALDPTCHHKNPRLMELAKNFAEENIRAASGSIRLFYVWGHSYEFRTEADWERMEEFCKKVANKDDTWYATNIEIYDYVEAYRALEYSVNLKKVYNPSCKDVWIRVKGKNYKIPSGKTVNIG